MAVKKSFTGETCHASYPFTTSFIKITIWPCQKSYTGFFIFEIVNILLHILFVIDTDNHSLL